MDIGILVAITPRACERCRGRLANGALSSMFGGFRRPVRDPLRSAVIGFRDASMTTIRKRVAVGEVHRSRRIAIARRIGRSDRHPIRPFSGLRRYLRSERCSSSARQIQRIVSDRAVRTPTIDDGEGISRNPLSIVSEWVAK